VGSYGQELWLLGVDFATAPLAVREPLSYTPEAATALLRSAKGLPGIREAVVVSTCNRTEFYLAADAGSHAAATWIDHVRRARPDAPIGHDGCVLFRASGLDAARHLFRVTCGLESSILGDVHIGGQLKKALALAGDAGTLGPFLSQAFRHAFDALKAARTHTYIGRGHASLGSAVAGLIEGRVGAEPPAILVIGGGIAARDIGRQLAKWRTGRLTFINRTRGKAHELARQTGGRSVAWDTLDRELCAADVVVAATSSTEPVVRREPLARSLAARAGRPLLVVDIGVPRNVEPVDGAECVTIDDIAARRDEALARRQQAVPDVEAIIGRELVRWEKWVWTRPGDDLIRRVFVEEQRQRAVLVDTLMAAGFQGSSSDLDRLIAKSWNRLLYGHARGLRQWLHAGSPIATSPAVESGRLGA
jgi:glutamyl-tRNA reductase